MSIKKKINECRTKADIRRHPGVAALWNEYNGGDPTWWIEAQRMGREAIAKAQPELEATK